MSGEKDRENWQKLVKQVKDVHTTFDKEVKMEVIEALSNKKLSYFLAIFAKDDGDIDDEEFYLMDWLMLDLFSTEDKKEYSQRIANMMRKQS